jgi:hypothetical protein
MKNLAGRWSRGRRLAVLAGAFVLAGTASAAPISSPVNVDFQGGKGTLSGYFQTDGSGNVSAWDFTTSAFGTYTNPISTPNAFPGLHY